LRQDPRPVHGGERLPQGGAELRPRREPAEDPAALEGQREGNDPRGSRGGVPCHQLRLLSHGREGPTLIASGSSGGCAK
jgi:hypothetical protein